MAHQKKESSETEDRLVGWLVSYGLDDMGYSYELRAGRSLITSEPSNNMRVMTLSEESVSAPHAAIKATTKHKVMIQDIFSDQGSYIAKQGTDKEIPVHGPMKLEHGDWIRVGRGSRFQVCLINGPSR